MPMRQKHRYAGKRSPGRERSSTVDRVSRPDPLIRPAVLIASALALVELCAVPTVQIPVSCVLFAVAFVASIGRLHAGGLAGPVAFGTLCAFELLLIPGYARTGAVDWAVQGTVLALAATGLVLALVLAARVLRRSGVRALVVPGTPR